MNKVLNEIINIKESLSEYKNSKNIFKRWYRNHYIKKLSNTIDSMIDNIVLDKDFLIDFAHFAYTVDKYNCRYNVYSNEVLFSRFLYAIVKTDNYYDYFKISIKGNFIEVSYRYKEGITTYNIKKKYDGEIDLYKTKFKDTHTRNIKTIIKKSIRDIFMIYIKE